MTVIPNFLLRKAYVKGSLQYANEGISFEVKNVISPGLITSVIGVTINELIFTNTDIHILTNEKKIAAHTITNENPIFVSLKQVALCVIITDKKPLLNGENKIKIEMVSREAGLIKVSVADTINGIFS